MIPLIPVNRKNKVRVWDILPVSNSGNSVESFYTSTLTAMRLNHPDYIKLLRATYHKITSTGEKPLLTQPTRTGIRRECINMYREGIEKKDEPIVRAFFGAPRSGQCYTKLIEHTDPDRFRPLQNYLKGETITTDAMNVELLAWLINFPHRPYRLDNMVVLTEEEERILGGDKLLFAAPEVTIAGRIVKEDKKEVSVGVWPLWINRAWSTVSLGYLG
jgi:hypothetical protein